MGRVMMLDRVDSTGHSGGQEDAFYCVVSAILKSPEWKADGESVWLFGEGVLDFGMCVGVKRQRFGLADTWMSGAGLWGIPFVQHGCSRGEGARCMLGWTVLLPRWWRGGEIANRRRAGWRMAGGDGCDC
jgi:hypothetical protein